MVRFSGWTDVCVCCVTLFSMLPVFIVYLHYAWLIHLLNPCERTQYQHHTEDPLVEWDSPIWSITMNNKTFWKKKKHNDSQSVTKHFEQCARGTNENLLTLHKITFDMLKKNSSIDNSLQLNWNVTLYRINSNNKVIQPHQWKLSYVLKSISL